MSTHQSNAQDSNKPRPQDPTSAAQQSAELVTTGAAAPGKTTPAMACNGLASPGPQETAEGQKLSRNGLTDFAPADPHEVRAQLTRRGSLNGLELDGGTGVVFIPQHALPDLRRRLLLAQERFTAMSGSVPGKRRRRPATAA
ncbi:hypothetical protein KVA01_15010 [Kocuria varians]|uniref:Uncharacterized protein n=1 Tax=Kocuria varians TaxID=1272 RepID=A0A4Y4D415_KOCVA|nr:hypothetical protein KVA01_15010 [Kocuria varians]